MTEQRIESPYVLYSCKACGITKARVAVRQRGPQEDVIHWLNGIQEMVGNHHRLNSPACTSANCDLMIPMDNANAAH